MENIEFSDLPNVAVITSKQIINHLNWIGYVSHDEEDGGWQFLELDRSGKSEDDAMIVALNEIIEFDPSIKEVADLPLGWYATRDTK